VGASEALPASVRDWEPVGALVPGPSGLEAYEAITAEVARWLAPGGAFVAEIGAGQGGAVVDLARRAGLERARVQDDHAGLDRVVVAARPS
jgi:release factor glutamine methyltransferase